MVAVLRIEGAGTSPETLHQEAVALGRLLAMQPGLVVERPEDGLVAPGEKGGLLAIGQMALSVLSTSGLDALLESLKLYVARSPELSIEIEEAGERIKVTARNLAPDQIVETTSRLRALLKSPA